MHDYSLGGPVDVGEYDGLLLDGKPLHKGSCEDGVYGCRACNSAMRFLSDEDLKKLMTRDGEPADVRTTDICDWCNKEVSIREISGVQPWDEPSCYYEVCRSCISSYHRELRKEEAYAKGYGYDDDWDDDEEYEPFGWGDDDGDDDWDDDDWD